MMCADCGSEEGEGSIDSGGFTPWGQPIEIPCPTCSDRRLRRLAAIGAAWEKDSDLEKWFPISARQLKGYENTFKSLKESAGINDGRDLLDWVATIGQQLKSAQAARDEWLWAYSVVDFVLKGIEGWETAKECGERGNALEAVTKAKALRSEVEQLAMDYESLRSLAAKLEPWTAHHSSNARTVSEYADQIYKACINIRPMIYAKSRSSLYEQMKREIAELKIRLASFEASKELNKPCATTA